MTIICPSCEASYRIGADELGDGRRVRCARCRAEWVARPEALAAEAGGPAEVEAEKGTEITKIQGLDDAVPIDAIDAVEASEPHALAEALDAQILLTRRSNARRFGFLGGAGRGSPARPAAKPVARKNAPRMRPVAAAAVLGVIAIGALLGGRVAVVRAAPSLATIYAVIGMPVNVRGLAIHDLRSVERIEEGTPLLLVSGMVENVSSAAMDVPWLRLAVLGSGDRELYAWTTVATRANLAPGESAAFRARLASPPAEGRGLSVRFLGRADIAARPAH